MDESAERQALAEVTQRLTARFGHLPPDVVAATVDDVAGQLQAARIREFIPLLVERQARDELRLHPRAAPAPSVPAQRAEVVWVEA
ncbi:three-helix bundle dimerization domain-containing protein [Nocardioides guangzhouensis]|uniref:three-helix bundle dimerization domain-containing protein n=1 Tax=Nocardioides guangzhouensis TaxID=2497878 RepID=UPI001FEAB5D5|nr:hypothetical protein [Nocardioides guangzhouensis]